MVLHSHVRYDQQGIEGNMVSVVALVHHEHIVHQFRRLIVGVVFRFVSNDKALVQIPISIPFKNFFSILINTLVIPNTRMRPSQDSVSR